MIIEVQWEKVASQKLLKAMEKMPEALKSSVRVATHYLKTLVVSRTPWRTGKTATSWSSVEYRDEGYSFGNPLPHTEYLETGYPYKKAGPSTVELNGKIYSKQAPGGIIAPIIYDEAIQRRVIEKVIAGFKAASNARA